MRPCLVVPHGTAHALNNTVPGSKKCEYRLSDDFRMSVDHKTRHIDPTEVRETTGKKGTEERTGCTLGPTVVGQSIGYYW